MTKIIKVDFDSGKIIPLKDPEDVFAIQFSNILNMTIASALIGIIKSPSLSKEIKDLAITLQNREWFIQFVEDIEDDE